MILSFIHTNLIRSEGMSTLSMIGSVSGSILNIILDPIFISVLGWGAFGAALATVLGYALIDAICLYFVLLYTCVFQATGKPVQALIMSLSRQGLLFLAVFLAVTAIWKYDGFLIAQPVSDALSAALALIMYRMTFVKENR